MAVSGNPDSSLRPGGPRQVLGLRQILLVSAMLDVPEIDRAEAARRGPRPTWQVTAVPALDAEDAVAANKRWSDLSQRNRRLIIVGGVAEGCLKTAALIDIKRRPASQIRGPKWIWATVVVVVNSFGGAPLAYFAFGRRR